MKTWDKKQLKDFLESVADERLAALWYTIASTGMRRGEAIGLRWSDVDLENARLSARRALIPIKGDVVVSEPKTAKGRRVIALDPSTVEVLKAQAARQLDEWDDAWIDPGLVFTAASGVTLHPESVSRYRRQAVKKSRLPPIRLHDLRHKHATLALQAGIHPKIRLRAPRACHLLDHPRHRVARHPGDAGGGGGADRGAGIRSTVEALARARFSRAHRANPGGPMEQIGLASRGRRPQPTS